MNSMNQETSVASSTVQPIPNNLQEQCYENTATTISTIVVRAEPHTTIAIAMLKSFGFVELRIDEMQLKLLEIGSNSSQTLQLLNNHDDLFSRLMSKQEKVEELLSRAAELVQQQNSAQDVCVYEAMAESLAFAWKNLNRQLELRGHILKDTYKFYELTQLHAQLTKQTNSQLQNFIESEVLADVAYQIQQSINELIGITAEAVDLGSSIITQIRILGSLADNFDRPAEIVNSCLIIEHEMLKLAQEWETIETFWGEERVKFELELEEKPSGNSKISGDLLKLKFDLRVEQFLQSVDSMLNQFEGMRVDLVNASAAMAGELGPLAQQKAGLLIDEGEALFRVGLSDSELNAIKEKLQELREQLDNFTQLVNKRIEEAKSVGVKLQNQLQSLNVWLSEYAEPFLSRNNNLGRDANSCSELCTRYKQFAIEVSNREPEVVSVLNVAHTLFISNSDRKYLEDFRKRYETLRTHLESRRQLGRSFEQILKFAKELDASFNTLESLLASQGTVSLSNDEIGAQIRNVFHIIRATLQQEAHEGRKFIDDVKNQKTDVNLKASEACEAIQAKITEHENRLSEISKKWDSEEESRLLNRNFQKILDEVQIWQIDTRELIERIQTLNTTQINQQQQQLIDSIICNQLPIQSQKLDQVIQRIGTRPEVERVLQNQRQIEVDLETLYRRTTDESVEKSKLLEPYFLHELQTIQTVTAGTTALLDCVIVARPEPKVIWFKEEETILESERVRLEFEGDRCSLRIHDVRMEDSGLYKIKAINDLGESTNFCRLSVVAGSIKVQQQQNVVAQPPQPPPKPTTPNALVFLHSQPPTFESDLLPNLVLVEGERAQFRIRIGGIPAPKVSWSFQDRQIQPNDSSFSIVESDGWHQLTIERVTLKHAGIYIVVAENPAGEARSGASLNVTKGVEGQTRHLEANIHDVHPESTTNMPYHLSAVTPLVSRHYESQDEILREERHFNYVEKDLGDMGYSSLANAPQLIRAFLPEYTASEGEHFQVDCLLVGNPRPRIHWYFNDIPITSNYQFAELENIGDTYSIGLKPARLENSGYYRMTAENIRGIIETKTLIHVRPRSMIPQPQFAINHHRGLKKTQSYESRRLIEDVDGVFGGRRGTPPAHQIFNSSARLSQLQNQLQLQQQQQQQQPKKPQRQMSTSLYQPQQLQHRGDESYASINYFNNPSEAGNPSKISYQIAEGDASTTGHPPHFLQTLVSSVTTEGEPARFEASVTGWPIPSVEWSKDGAPLDLNRANRLRLNVQGGNATLHIDKALIEDSGKYMCTARNSSGVATSSAQLVVRTQTIAPDFIERLISEEAVEGQRLCWQVRVCGDPQPRVTWLRDGQLIPDCDEVKLLNDGDGQYSMIIECLEQADGGQFTCLLENEAGEARSTADLLVRAVGEQPGSYFHITKVTQEKQLKGEEVSRNETVSVQNPQGLELAEEDLIAAEINLDDD